MRGSPAQLAWARRLQWARVTWLTSGPGGVKLQRKKMLHRFGWTQAVTFDGSQWKASHWAEEFLQRSNFAIIIAMIAVIIS